MGTAVTDNNLFNGYYDIIALHCMNCTSRRRLKTYQRIAWIVSHSERPGGTQFFTKKMKRDDHVCSLFLDACMQNGVSVIHLIYFPYIHDGIVVAIG